MNKTTTAMTDSTAIAAGLLNEAIRQQDKGMYAMLIKQLSQSKPSNYDFNFLLDQHFRTIYNNPYDVEKAEFELFCISALGDLDAQVNLNFDWADFLDQIQEQNNPLTCSGLVRGINVSTTHYGLTQLIDKDAERLAIDDLHTAMMKVFLGSFKNFDINNYFSNRGANLFMLMMASYAAEPKLMQVLLDHGADPMLKTKQYGYAFQFVDFISPDKKFGFPSPTLGKLALLHELGVDIALQSPYQPAVDYAYFNKVYIVREEPFSSLLDEVNELAAADFLEDMSDVHACQALINRCVTFNASMHAQEVSDAVSQRRKRVGGVL